MRINYLRDLFLLSLICLPVVPLSASSTSVLQPPSARFQNVLTHFKLQLPEASSRSTGVSEIDGNSLGQFANTYFHSDASGNLIFVCPDNGATTANSHFPRTELRNMREWSLVGDEAHALHGTLMIARQPRSGKIIFAQIHGRSKGSGALKLEWDNNSVIALVKTALGGPSLSLPLAMGMQLGETIDYAIEFANRRLIVTVNGHSQSVAFDQSWAGNAVYFKAGNYLQDDSGRGTVGEVVYTSLADN